MGSEESSPFAELGRRLFREAVEAAGHSVYFTDRNGVIQYVNPAFEEMTGYSAEEAVGKTPRILKSGEHDDGFYEELWETILSGDIWRNELINQRKTGERYVVDQTVAPVENDDDEITHFVAINVDITDQHDYERRLERQNERLDEFASVVSHDLNNMLTVASGNADLAKETGDLSYLDRVEEAHDRMAELTDELLTLARSGDTVDAEEPVSLPGTVDEAWCTTATGEATLVRENADVEVVADKERLKQALENLFRNAVEHGSRDHESLTVRVGVAGDTLYVEDDGGGIDSSDQQSVFRKGYTTDDSGNGYGLTIVRNIVEAHGWDIEVTEGREGGARFEITGVDVDCRERAGAES